MEDNLSSSPALTLAGVHENHQEENRTTEK